MSSTFSKKTYAKFSPQDWKERLSDEQYRVTRKSGTEAPFRNEFWDHKEHGVYHCVCCETPLFKSDNKFDSGTGWPSFTKPYEDHNIAIKLDRKLFTVRTEVLCKNCNSHLGHVFDDEPAPTRKRYCINSASLSFTPKP